MKTNASKALLCFYAALLLTAVMTNTALADFNIYMADEEGSSTQQTIFEWDEKPWLHIELPYPDKYNVAVSWWVSPTGDLYYTSTLNNADFLWISLDSGFDTTSNPVNWFDVREVGDWTVSASYHYASGAVGSDSTSFTVTPEPVSSVLFVVGGTVFALKRYRRNKRKKH